MAGEAAKAMISSASGGPSMSTTAGSSPLSAASRLRAEPGPWCLMPKMCSRSGAPSAAIFHITSRMAP